MLNYIKAENLKCNRTFARKLIFIAPIFMVILAYISGKYFVEGGFNWWYTIISPGYITLLTALVNQNDDKKLNYRAVYALPVSLQRTWISKVLLICFYVAVSSAIHMTGIIIGKLTYNPASIIQIHEIVSATFIIIVTSLWQIPLCLFLSKKFGIMSTVLINVGGGIVLDIIMAAKPFWWACPYSYTTRLMCPILGILPNGLMAEKGNSLLNGNVISVGIILSLILFILFLMITAYWFSKQEVK